MRTNIKNAKRIVVKIGTTSITHKNGNLNLRKMEELARVLTDIRNSGREVILVSSGAIGAGMNRMGMNEKPTEIKDRQATAAIGQAILMQLYEKFFNEINQPIAQLLLTKEVLTNGIQKDNTLNTVYRLLEMGVIPIVNENDTVATHEIEGSHIGDNDTLSAMLSVLIDSDLLIILSDVAGLYDCSPHENTCANLIKVVNEINKEIYDMVSGTSSKVGTGGMDTKVKAAEISTKAGIDTLFANGTDVRILHDILTGEEIGTLFLGKK